MRDTGDDAGTSAAVESSPVVSRIAESFVRLGLELARHDPASLAYYVGPAPLADEAEAAPRPLADIRFAALPLVAQLETLDAPGRDDEAQRRAALILELQALTARAELLDGVAMSFADEAWLLHGVELPPFDEAVIAEAHARLDELLPGTGPLAERLASFRRAHAVPAERRDTVFRAALAEARRRTAAAMELPAGEQVEVEWVTGQPWRGRTEYLGEGVSRVLLPADATATVSELLDLATRYAYPGLHVAYTIGDARWAMDRGWIEHTLALRYSPRGFLVDAAAAIAADVAFPGADRLAFERDVLYPLAGLDPAGAADYDAVRPWIAALEAAHAQAASLYLGGELDAGQAAAWLAEKALLAPADAERAIRRIDALRAGVLADVVARSTLRSHVTANGTAAPGEVWRRYEALITGLQSLSTLTSAPTAATP